MSLLFKRFTSKHIVYNATWEDPRIDRKILGINQDSVIFSITSAGCNALDYLLDNPKQIDCIDANPCQNALLNLKKSLFKSGSMEELQNLFQNGSYDKFSELLDKKLSEFLDDEDVAFWKKRSDMFSSKGMRSSFYFQGTSGGMAFIISLVMSLFPNKKKIIQEVFNAESIEAQAEAYKKIRPYFWNSISKILMTSRLARVLVGVPAQQEKLIKDQTGKSIGKFWIDQVDHVFTTIHIRDNYFWRAYVYGCYEEDCKPNYLDKDYFNFYADNIDKINTYTTTIIDFLKSTDRIYSHFILLDHMDWMYENSNALEEEWNEIINHSDIGTKVLIRTGGLNDWFVPDIARQHFQFNDEELQLEELHKLDRVGTYGSTHLGVRVTENASLRLSNAS